MPFPNVLKLAGSKSGRFGITCAFAMLLFQNWAFAAPGILESVSGKVQISQSSGLQRPAQKNVQLYEGDTITTGDASTAQIRMIDNAVILLRPNSSINIEKYDYAARGGSKDKAILNLIKGILRTTTGAIGKTNKSDYVLKTPLSTIGIRGTEFQAAFIGAGAIGNLAGVTPGTYLIVYFGTVGLNANGATVDVPQGKSAFVGLAPGSQPSLLPSLPSFLEEKKAELTPAKAEVRAGSSTIPEKPKQFLVSVRFGELSEESSSRVVSSRSAVFQSEEQSVRVMSGNKGILTFSEATRSATGQGAGSLSQSVVEVVARLNGDSVDLQVQIQRANADRRQSGSQAVVSTLNVKLGQWALLSGSGSGDSSSSSVASSRTSTSTKVYVKAVVID